MGMHLAHWCSAMISPRRPPCHIAASQKGFTLIESMIVVAIATIATALAAPDVVRLYARYELYQATTTFYNRLVLARSAAITRNTMIVATPVNLPGGQAQVTFTAPFTSDEFSPNISFVLPLPAQPIGFTSRGLSTVPLATQTIQLQSLRNPTLVYSISVAPSGKVTWCAFAVAPCLTS